MPPQLCGKSKSFPSGLSLPKKNKKTKQSFLTFRSHIFRQRFLLFGTLFHRNLTPKKNLQKAPQVLSWQPSSSSDVFGIPDIFKTAFTTLVTNFCSWRSKFIVSMSSFHLQDHPKVHHALFITRFGGPPMWIPEDPDEVEKKPNVFHLDKVITKNVQKIFSSVFTIQKNGKCIFLIQITSCWSTKNPFACFSNYIFCLRK